MSEYEGLSLLRKEFPPEAVGKLPRVTCRACRDAGRGKACDRHTIKRCDVCGNFGSTGHIHLDYVGHAEVTDRLLSADPTWNWEPVAWTEEGLPRVVTGADGSLLLWIRLTACGVTRLGVGSVAAKTDDAEKQLISDALRNASMRFGVALSLWAKSELESALVPTDVDPTTGEITGGGDRGTARVTPAPTASEAPVGTTLRPPPQRRGPTSPADTEGDDNADKAASETAVTSSGEEGGDGEVAPPSDPEAKPNAYAKAVATRARELGIEDGPLLEVLASVDLPSLAQVDRGNSRRALEALAAHAAKAQRADA